MIKRSVEEAMFRIEGGQVERVHTLPKLSPYLNSVHVYEMLHLLRVFFPEHYVLPVVSYILDHDVAEKVVGDSPWAAKYPLSDGQIGAMLHDAEQPVVDEFFLSCDDAMLTDDQKAVVSFLDRFQFFVWACGEVQMGNRRIASKPRETLDLLRTSEIYKDAPIVWDGIFEGIQEYTIAEDCDWWDRVVRKHNNGGHGHKLGRGDVES